MGIKGCCKDCPIRHEACHDTCEKYQKARREWEAHKEMVSESKKPSEYDEYRFKSIRAMKRRKFYDRKS